MKSHRQYLSLVYVSSDDLKVTTIVTEELLVFLLKQQEKKVYLENPSIYNSEQYR